jgi:hypothetical protein
MRRNSRARVLILLLAAVLAATPVLAAPREPAPAFRQAPGIFASFWQMLERFLPPLTKGRDTIDPNGTTRAESDGRSTIDPDGLGTSESDGRGTLDPNG